MGSKRRIEAEIGEAVTAFAYPNGLAGDYRPGEMEMLRCEGFSAAFTLADGPSQPDVVRRDPLQIRRVLIMGQDDIASFTAKIVGATRVLRNVRRACGSVGQAFGAA